MGNAAPGLPDNPGFFVPGHSGALQQVLIALIQNLTVVGPLSPAHRPEHGRV